MWGRASLPPNHPWMSKSSKKRIRIDVILGKVMNNQKYIG